MNFTSNNNKKLHIHISSYISGDSKILNEIQQKLTNKDRKTKFTSTNELIEYLKKSLTSTKPSVVYRSLTLIQELLNAVNDDKILILIIKACLETNIISISTTKLRNVSERAQYLINEKAGMVLKLFEEVVISCKDTRTITTSIGSSLDEGSVVVEEEEGDKMGVFQLQSKITCIHCHQNNVPMVPFQCTSDPQCMNCVREYLVQCMKRGGGTKTLEFNCPLCRGHLMDRPLIIGCLGLDQAQQYRQGHLDKNKFEVIEECPRCKYPAYMSDDAMFLGQCGICQSFFCTNCKGVFHGMTDCSMANDSTGINGTLSEKTGQNEVGDASTSSLQDSQHKGQGAEGTKYELDFYNGRSDKREEEINERIKDAFESNCHPKAKPLFPWEIPDSFPSYTTYHEKYSCLKPETWLDDVLIEKTIYTLIDQFSPCKNNVVLLESFMLPAFCNFQDEEFCEMVKQKQIQPSDTLFALMNTDTQSVGGHWILGIVNQTKKRIIIQDTSMVLSSTFYRKFFYYLLNVIHVSRNGRDFNSEEWKLCISLNTIQQRNAYDCGPYVIANVYADIYGRCIEETPDSESLRGWIHYLLITTEGGGLKSERKVDNSNLGGFEDEPVPSFNPKNLSYNYC